MASLVEAAAEEQTLADGTVIRELVDVRGGRINRRIHNDQEIFDLEQERIFRQSWCFLAHESEIPNPGDFVTRDLACEPVVVIRDDDGNIGGFLNACRHRGVRVCRTDSGNTNYMRCPYHGWAYAKTGELVGAFAEDFYTEELLDKESFGLVPVGGIASYKGLIFATWAENPEPLEDFLGDMKFYLDLLVGRTDGGTELIGVPQMWEASANWKLLAENSCDSQHLPTAHGSVVQLGLLPPEPMSLAAGHLIATEGGHIAQVLPGPPIEHFQYFGLPAEVREQMQRNLNPAQLGIVKTSMTTVGNVFPNLSWVHAVLQGNPEAEPTPFFALRLWQPLGPSRSRVIAFLVVDKETSPEFRKRSMETYVRCFGPSGIFEQDDMENLEECTRMGKGAIARRHPMHHSMSLHVEPISDYPGPGRVWPFAFGENAQVAMYEEWVRRLSTPTAQESGQ
jgi:PAH dioxygenase large subunit